MLPLHFFPQFHVLPEAPLFKYFNRGSIVFYYCILLLSSSVALMFLWFYPVSEVSGFKPLNLVSISQLICCNCSFFCQIQPVPEAFQFKPLNWGSISVLPLSLLLASSVALTFDIFTQRQRCLDSNPLTEYPLVNWSLNVAIALIFCQIQQVPEAPRFRLLNLSWGSISVLPLCHCC